MKRLWTIFWEVDGASGSTFVRASNLAECKAYFRVKFAPFGYAFKGAKVGY